MSEAIEIDDRAQSKVIGESLERLRVALEKSPGLARTAGALAATFDRWRERDFPERSAALAKIADDSQWSAELLNESIDALLAPFTRDALVSFASKGMPLKRLGGFIIPRNISRAGVPELVI